VRFFDDLVVLGSVAAYPQQRHALSHVEPHHLREGWIGQAWRTVWSIADADDDAGRSHQVRIERVIDAAPNLKQHAIHMQTAWSEGRRLYDEAETCADRIVARWQANRYRTAAEDIVAAFQQGEKDGDFAAALSQQRTAWDSAEHEATAAGAVLDVMRPQELAQHTHSMLEARINNPEQAFGIRTDWGMWDKVHRGARPGRANFTIAPTGTGKTSFLLNLASRIAQHEPCLYINLEMTPDDVGGRLASIALAGRADLDSIEGGSITPQEAEYAAVQMATSKLHVTSPSEKTANTISALMARYAVRHGVKWICVDHLLEVAQTPQERREGAHWKSHVEWCRRWHGLAVKYGFTLEIVSQCGRDDMSFGQGAEPSFRNMQGASAVLNHMDTARILWRDKHNHVVSVKKNRGGRAPVAVDFDFKQTHGLWSELGFHREGE